MIEYRWRRFRIVSWVFQADTERILLPTPAKEMERADSVEAVLGRDVFQPEVRGVLESFLLADAA